MNLHEIERIAAAVNVLRPDWPAASLRTLIGKHLAERPRRDVLVALAWVASDSESKTPARILEAGPWWRAAATEALPNGHQHAAKVHGWNEGDPRTVCGICGMDRPDCERRAQTNGHEFVARINCLPPIDQGVAGAIERLRICGAEVLGGTACRLRAGHDGDHAMSATKEPDA